MKWIKTAHKGLRYYEHETKKNGLRKDRYYAIRFKVDGKDYGYGIGWVSDGIPEEIKNSNPGIGFEEYCLSQMRIYKANVKSGSGVISPKEKRKQAEAKRQVEKEAAEQEQRDNLTFADVWEDYHGDNPEGKSIEELRARKKYDREDQLYRLWIAPVISEMKIKLIAPMNLERIKKNMADAGRAPRSIQYAFALIRQVYNFAKRNKLFEGEIPTKNVKLPKVDNERTRYLTPDEANILLQALKEKSQDTHDICLLSLHCGLRFGEVAHLKWSDIDYERGLLLIRDAKAGTRRAFLTEQTAEMLKNRIQGEPYDLIFPSRDGSVMKQISNSFIRTVNELGLNDGIDDRRQKLVLHSARHSFGSLLAEQGQDLYTIQRLIGHKTIAMTQRYSHLTENKLKNAVESLSKAFKENKDNMISIQEVEVVNSKK